MSTVHGGGVRFRIHPQDHEPVHAHGRYAETVVVVDLYADGSVGLADRDDAIIPRNAKASDVRRILRAAGEHYEAIVEAWMRMQGQ
ncbi:MAG TPA: DUF4160 domain-containing protein [Candidatus Sulfotelmatobacter sp.]|nr:DUF4160 domain-containing protein [Candidatus Sulfotelmatobacter sp.]